MTIGSFRDYDTIDQWPSSSIEPRSIKEYSVDQFKFRHLFFTWISQLYIW